MADLLCVIASVHTYTPVHSSKFDFESRINCRNTVIFGKVELIKLNTELTGRKFAHNLQHFVMIKTLKCTKIDLDLLCQGIV